MSETSISETDYLDYVKERMCHSLGIDYLEPEQALAPVGGHSRTRSLLGLDSLLPAPNKHEWKPAVVILVLMNIGQSLPSQRQIDSGLSTLAQETGDVTVMERGTDIFYVAAQGGVIEGATRVLHPNDTTRGAGQRRFIRNLLPDVLLASAETDRPDWCPPQTRMIVMNDLAE